MLRMRTSFRNLSQSGLLGVLGDITKTLRKAIQCSSCSSLSNGARIKRHSLSKAGLFYSSSFNVHH